MKLRDSRTMGITMKGTVLKIHRPVYRWAVDPNFEEIPNPN